MSTSTDLLRMEEPVGKRTRSQRALSDNGRKLFRSKCLEFQAKLNHTWKSVEKMLPEFVSGEFDVLELREQEKQLTKQYNKYKKISRDYTEYLIRTNTKESGVELMIQNAVLQANEEIIEQAVDLLDNQIQFSIKSLSCRTHSAKASKSIKSSSHGSLSPESTRKRAKANAAHAIAEFAVKESCIKKKQALLDRQKIDLEADLEVIRRQKDAAAAKAEADAFSSSSKCSGESTFNKSLHLLPEQRSAERTEQYVNRSQRAKGSDTPHRNMHAPLAEEQFETNLQPSNRRFETNTEYGHAYDHRLFVDKNEPTQDVSYNQQYSTGRPPATTSVPVELSRFLLQKDILTSRLVLYDDQPETYGVWKAGFLSVISELQASPSEELDLLIKWLGPSSRKHAVSIRTANANNPTRGLYRLWERLDERFGSPEIVESALKKRLMDFPKITNKESKRLYDLADLLSEIESVKENELYRPSLSYFDSSTGVIPIVRKLPFGVQEKWTNMAFKYKKDHLVPFPPFAFFVEFVRDIATAKNDPSFAHEEPSMSSVIKKDRSRQNPTIFSRKTEIKEKTPPARPKVWCPLHDTNHSLNECRGFRTKPMRERKEFLKLNKICFKCCSSTDHVAHSCTEAIKCTVCESEQHATALHNSPTAGNSLAARSNHGGESSTLVTNNCLQVCGEGFEGKSCAKTVLVNVYPQGQPKLSKKMYALLDDQSNVSLAAPQFFDLMNINSRPVPYVLLSCAGSVDTAGRRAIGYVIEANDGSDCMTLPPIIECNQIPNIRSEIPTPQVAQHFQHLSEIVHDLPPLDDDVEILLLIGRDLLEAHHVQRQLIGPPNTPYAQKLRLGWVVVGEACLGHIHRSDMVNVNKTYILPNGRPTLFMPCPNKFDVKKKANELYDQTVSQHPVASLIDPVFSKTADDDKVGLSIEDKSFLAIMDEQIYRDQYGNWSAPLPFKSPRVQLPNNKPQAVKRAQTLHRSLQRDPVKKEHFLKFMQGIFDKGHCEIAPTLNHDEERWYLPIFGVYHPKKPDRIRGVFDSSALYQGVSLNNTLLTGPDLTNSLIGILMRFRKEAVAISADVEQMFYNFKVHAEHRNFLRFLWYRDNDPTNELIEYRMCVHVFGNSPSPAIATYGLRKAVDVGEVEFGKDVMEFVHRNFYVDDGLTSLPTSSEAVDLIQRTQEALQKGGNIRLHKVASNSSQVMDVLPADDRASSLKDLDFQTDTLPLQRSLGLVWNLERDTFTFHVNDKDKPFSKRGVLSTINSLYDPLGFVSPVTIEGKIILRNLLSTTYDWDDPLPAENLSEWETWKLSLQSLHDLDIPRAYSPFGTDSATSREIHIFSDASEQAIAAVAYLKTTFSDNQSSVGFILGKAKVAPLHGHTIPRLELCAAVLAVEILDIVCDNIDFTPNVVRLYTDSKIVLGYIHNTSRRFFIYVANRVERIRRSSVPEQWHYVSSNHNPADKATRSLHPGQLPKSNWLMGPSMLLTDPWHDDISYPLMSPEKDQEVRPQAVTLVTKITPVQNIGSHRFERFSSYDRLIKTIASLKHIAQSFKTDSPCKGWHLCDEARSIKLKEETEQFIIRSVQHEIFGREVECLRTKKPLPKDSSLLCLDPYLDELSLIRVGGRLKNSDLPHNQKHPIILPARHHVTRLVVTHYHKEVKHQGRHFTEGAVRSAGFWVIGAKRLISSIIHGCVSCKKLRGKRQFNKMASLPEDRLVPGPPFSFVGVDTFGPWSIVSRRTRGGQATSKRWAIIFTCLTSRAIHIEIVEDMESSSFINALRRLISIRGKVTEFRSDRGTNFVGALDDLQIDSVRVEDGPVRAFLYNRGVTWRFNPPHASHMGGVWERLIGVTRRILDSMLSDVAPRNLTHDVLVTFMAEVAAIINARPLVPVSTDPEGPEVLSPSTLLTLKSDHSTEPSTDWTTADLYKAQWRRVQALADMFWKRWREEYLSTLQVRRKWQEDVPNVNKGDVVLLADKSSHRNDWPMGVVLDPLAGEDGRVRKATVRIIKDGRPTVYLRPVTELVSLISAE